MRSVFEVEHYEFPYSQVRFPGQASDERILYVGREAKVMLWMRLLSVGLASTVLGAIGLVGLVLLPATIGTKLVWLIGVLGLSGLFGIVGSWWMWRLWKLSIFAVTTRRLTKFIYTTPWNRHNLSLGLDKIVDTGAYARGYFQAMWRIGTFTARSSAGNRRDKYFFVENVHVPEDLANYVNKVLFAYGRDIEKLDSFRPFLPFLKGGIRKKFMEKYPEFWS